ncbi:MAG: hypothetical protein ACTSQS_11095 [Promethearchaeota archaeon]
MQPSLKFRKIREIEWSIIRNSFEKISPKILEFFKEKIDLFYVKISNIKSESYPEIYLLNYDLNTIINKISRNLSINIYSAGIYFGYIKRGKFYLSLEGAEYIFKNNLFPQERIIIVKESIEKAVLYGNHIKKKDIEQDVIKKYPFNKGDLILIINKFHEVLALGRLTINSNKFEDKNYNEIIIQNLIDKGYYLRKE